MKMKTGLLASAVVLGMALALPMGASAADTDSSSGDTATKSASVDVSAGSLLFTKDDNGMQEAPSFQFNDAKVTSAAQKELTTKGFDNTTADSKDTYKDSILSVDDNTGSGAGWTVSATLGAFSDGAEHDLEGATLTMNAATPTGTTTTPAATLTAPATSGAGTAVPVFTAAKDAGMGTSSTDLKGATLDIPANTANYAGTYTAPLTYTLTSGPTA